MADNKVAPRVLIVLDLHVSKGGHQHIQQRLVGKAFGSGSKQFVVSDLPKLLFVLQPSSDRSMAAERRWESTDAIVRAGRTLQRTSLPAIDAGGNDEESRSHESGEIGRSKETDSSTLMTA